jgi:DNA repair exonuclease SbcCD ATPase subunit
MKLKTCEVWNFGSYPHFSIDFSNIGLGLIYGATGSGKSTIQDMPCWILYGVTAKEGAADEVRAWQSPGEPTKGTLEVELSDGVICVTRIRGKSAQNDLYWTEAGSDEPHRGKDIVDTQKRLSARLGVTADTYLAAAYFHEFSATGLFFTAKAKDRRALFERVASLDLPVRIAEKASDARKVAKADLATVETNYNKMLGRLEQLKTSVSDVQSQLQRWDASREKLLSDLAAKVESFETDRAKRQADLEQQETDFEVKRDRDIDAMLAALDEVQAKIEPGEALAAKIADIKGEIERLGAARCPTCSAPTNSQKRFELQAEMATLRERKVANDADQAKFATGKKELKRITEAANPYTSRVAMEKTAKNHYADQLEAERAKSNPFNAQLQGIEADIVLVESAVKDFEGKKSKLSKRVSDLTQLYDLSYELRGELLKKAVKEIESATNRYLETYFDAELRVSFTLEGADNLEVGIQKSGYDCVFKQLSKGQRGLLKLAFVVSVMSAVANSAGVHFANLCFDEALDGLDTDLKVKAFGLFQELETNHETVLLIDHCTEFKSLFAKQFRVTMTGDVSEMLDEGSAA